MGILVELHFLFTFVTYEVSDLESHIYTVTHTDGHTDTHGFTHTHIHTHSLTHIVYHFDLEIVIIQNNIISR